MATEKKTSKTNKDSYWKEGRYRHFTDIYGVFNNSSFKRNSTGRLVSKHKSLEEANNAAKELFNTYNNNGGDAIKSETNGMFYGDIRWMDNYPPSTVKISVKELTLDKLKINELLELKIKYDIKNNTTKQDHELTPNDLIKLIYPIIQHKMHENRRKEKELLNCLLCQEIYKDEYDKLMEKRNKDPDVIRQRLQGAMFRKKIINPITEKQVKKKYGIILTEKCISNGVTEQKLHWNTKSCFGNIYRVYEKDEIEKYYDELKNKTVRKNKKRHIINEECKSEPPLKKQKLNKSGPPV
eukprot:974952_1